MKTIFLLVASLFIATNWVFADEEPNLDDPKVLEKILKGAVMAESLELRGPGGERLLYQAGDGIPYTGWAKMVWCQPHRQVGRQCVECVGHGDGQPLPFGHRDAEGEPG